MYLLRSTLGMEQSWLLERAFQPRRRLAGDRELRKAPRTPCLCSTTSMLLLLSAPPPPPRPALSAGPGTEGVVSGMACNSSERLARKAHRWRAQAAVHRTRGSLSPQGTHLRRAQANYMQPLFYSRYRLLFSAQKGDKDRCLRNSMALLHNARA